MTIAEFSKEFDNKYDLASSGAPDLNNYEKSFFLTEAIREIIDELYTNYENSEYVKRALNPLVKEKDLILASTSDYYAGINVYEVTLPSDIYFILQENVKLSTTCSNPVEVFAEDLDNLNKTIKNPFKKPNKRKVLRTEIGGNNVRLYSSDTITDYKIKYIKKYSPIILSNFSSDPELLGSETIDGLNTTINTELPVFMHHKIVDRAVILAIKSFRENNLKTQIEV